MPLARLAFLLLPFAALFADTLTVGPQGKYAKPCQALAAAKDADTILIDAAGNYDGDVCIFRASNLLIRGVNGRPRIDAAGADAQGKGIWVVAGNHTTVENIEMSGAAVPDKNGACIRLEGVGLTLRHVYFHNNQEGVLTNGRNGDILIEYSEFDLNGDGEGYAHNIYIGHERRLIVRYSYFHRSLVGNVIKSRAAANYFYNNVFASEDAPSSWEVDLPNGGVAVLVGNVIQQGPLSENPNILSYMLEGPVAGRANSLHIVHNTFVNEGRGEADGSPTYFILPAKANYPGLVANNIFAGPGLLMPDDTRSIFEIRDNLTDADPLFANPSAGDFRLNDNSPAAAKAGPLPANLASLLTPTAQYQPAACAQLRPSAYPAALGAFESGPAEPNLSTPCSIASPLDFAWITPSLSTLTASLTQPARLHLAGLAPTAGATVRILYSHPSLVSGPAEVTIPAGESSAVVNLTCTAPSGPTYVTLTAVYREQAQDSTLFFNIPVVIVPAPARVVLSPASLPGGAASSGNYVQLNTSAPKGGLTLNLASSNPALASVPASLTIAEGRSFAAFAITSHEVSTPSPITISASLDSASVSATLLLSPVAISRIDLPARNLGAPGAYRGRVFLNGPAPASGFTAQLSSSIPEAITLPAQVSIPATASSAFFDIATTAPGAPVSGHIKASAGDSSRTVALTVDVLSISAVALAPASLTGGLTSGNHRVLLSGPAFENTPVTISLSSSNPAVAAVPAQITIPAGASSAPFQIVTSPQSSAVDVVITASAAPPLPGPSSRSATFTVKP